MCSVLSPGSVYLRFWSHGWWSSGTALNLVLESLSKVLRDPAVLQGSVPGVFLSLGSPASVLLPTHLPAGSVSYLWTGLMWQQLSSWEGSDGGDALQAWACTPLANQGLASPFPNLPGPSSLWSREVLAKSPTQAQSTQLSCRLSHLPT